MCVFSLPRAMFIVCIFVPHLNTLRPRRNEQHFADYIFKRIFFNEKVWISMKMLLYFVPKGPINNTPALVQIMAWRRSGDKPLSEPIMVSLPPHIWVMRPQWVRSSSKWNIRNSGQSSNGNFGVSVTESTNSNHKIHSRMHGTLSSFSPDFVFIILQNNVLLINQIDTSQNIPTMPISYLTKITEKRLFVNTFWPNMWKTLSLNFLSWCLSFCHLGPLRQSAPQHGSRNI